MHSLTYTQKSCRQNAGSRDAYVYIRTFFATRKLQRAGQRAESKKNAYTIYTLNVHFLYSKSAYTIYTPETTFPAGSSTSNGPVTTLPPRKFAGSRQKQDKLPPTTTALPPHTHTHILRAAELSIRRSKAKQPQCNHYNTSKRGAYLPSRRHTHIFSPIFPASFKTADREHTSDRRRKKRKRGMKRC